MSSDLPDHAIQLQGVSKHYLIYKRPEDRLKQMIMPKLRRVTGMKPRAYFTDFAAVHDVDFTVERGETVGIIGRNGSGKSTLLQMICGILQPSSGSVEVNGRIAALLELGAGFNADFTGRENVFLNAAILGLTREETEARFDSIARFADIGMFIDQPVKTYSSGMYVRLAFAVAINVDPDILVVDEALSVGDEAFQRKCFARIEQIRESGATILFVSHSAQTIVQLCDRAILMDRGQKLLDGSPRRVVSQYQRFINLTGTEADAVRAELQSMDVSLETDPSEEMQLLDSNQPASLSEGTPEGVFSAALDADSKEAELLEVLDPGLVSHTRVDYEHQGATLDGPAILNASGNPVNSLVLGRNYAVQCKIRFDDDAHDVEIGHHYSTANGLHLGGRFITKDEFPQLKHVEAGTIVSVSFKFECRFVPSTYFLSFGVRGVSNDEHKYLARSIDSQIFRVISMSPIYFGGHFDFRMQPSLENTPSVGID